MHTVEARTILSPQNGMNLYRGCTHGCIYCDSRSACYGFAHPFDDVEVKTNAAELLEQALRRRRTRCMLGTGSMTDPYIPLEEEFRLVRRALELADRYGFGFTLITKSARVLRDLDLLRSIHSKAKCVVQMTLTTRDEALCRRIEPHVSTTRERFEALKPCATPASPPSCGSRPSCLSSTTPRRTCAACSTTASRPACAASSASAWA